MAYYIGDIPSEAIVLDPPDTITLDDFDTATAEIVDPAGTATAVPATIDTSLQVIVIDPPNDASLFTVDGVHRLRVRVTAPAGYVQRIPDVPLVVQDVESEWHTLDTARAEWADAEHLSDPMLWELLAVARNDVETFAPVLVDSAGLLLPIPTHYRKGQIMHARNILNAAGVDPTAGDGEGSFVLRPFPLDWQVKQTLRPRRWIGGVR